MAEAVLDKQLIVTVNNQVGTLAEVTHVIAESKINLVAICAYAVDNKGIIMFVSDNNALAKKLLTAKKYSVREEEVVLVTLDNKPGALQALSSKIAAAGIDMTLIYGSVEKGRHFSRLVLVSEDNDAVIMNLRLK